jgi:hypothetical protein
VVAGCSEVELRRVEAGPHVELVVRHGPAHPDVRQPDAVVQRHDLAAQVCGEAVELGERLEPHEHAAVLGARDEEVARVHLDALPADLPADVLAGGAQHVVHQLDGAFEQHPVLQTGEPEPLVELVFRHLAELAVQPQLRGDRGEVRRVEVTQQSRRAGAELGEQLLDLLRREPQVRRAQPVGERGRQLPAHLGDDAHHRGLDLGQLHSCSKTLKSRAVPTGVPSPGPAFRLEASATRCGDGSNGSLRSKSANASRWGRHRRRCGCAAGPRRSGSPPRTARAAGRECCS